VDAVAADQLEVLFNPMEWGTSPWRNAGSSLKACAEKSHKPLRGEFGINCSQTDEIPSLFFIL